MPKDSDKLNRLVAQARRERMEWDQSYRGQALKILPHVCAHCGREFSGKRLKELTVHHKDNDHNNNPPDGSNWELLCIYCHDNTHTRSLQAHGYVAPQAGGQSARTTYKPFENLKALLQQDAPKEVVYGTMQPGEEEAVCALVTRVFNSFVAKQYSQEGIDEFFKFANTDAMSTRVQANHFVLLAETDSNIVGMIEMRDWEHICLLFVEEQFQGQGIAREMLERALEICAGKQTGQFTITVNASPNAVEAYRHFGFQAMSSEQTKNGIRFIPMTLTISESWDKTLD